MHFTTIGDLIYLLVALLSKVIPVMASLAILYFLWGVAQFVMNASEPKKLGEGKSKMVWGIIVLFVIFSLGGLLVILESTFFPP